MRFSGWVGWRVDEIERAGCSGSFSISQVEINHRRGDVGVAEDVLEGSDVGIGGLGVSPRISHFT